MDKELLAIEDISIEYEMSGANLRAVTDASITVSQNESVGLVGESGCGKSTLAKSIIGGLDPNSTIRSGVIKFKGDNILDYSESELNRKIRWNEISYIPQSSMNSLDPVTRISKQAVELGEVHEGWKRARTLDRLAELFDVVGIPRERIDDYPYQFSGGMQQRAIIALSLLLDPSLVIADEPTTALDVIMQSQVIDYIHRLQKELDVALLIITHDISVVFQECDSMVVMHGGQVAESGDVVDLYEDPRHPYTIMLQKSFPDIRDPGKELFVIEGHPPELTEGIDFCTFKERCPWAEPECHESTPQLVPKEEGSSHEMACFRHEYVNEVKDGMLEAEMGTGEL